jgi:hypothetical protein
MFSESEISVVLASAFRFSAFSPPHVLRIKREFIVLYAVKCHRQVVIIKALNMARHKLTAKYEIEVN